MCCKHENHFLTRLDLEAFAKTQWNLTIIHSRNNSINAEDSMSFQQRISRSRLRSAFPKQIMEIAAQLGSSSYVINTLNHTSQKSENCAFKDC